MIKTQHWKPELLGFIPSSATGLYDFTHTTSVPPFPPLYLMDGNPDLVKLGACKTLSDLQWKGARQHKLIQLLGLRSLK